MCTSKFENLSSVFHTHVVRKNTWSGQRDGLISIGVGMLELHIAMEGRSAWCVYLMLAMLD